MSGSPPQRTGTDIIHLNVGGKKFSTSRQTLTQVQSIISIFAHFFIFQSINLQVQDTFFTGLLSGRIQTSRDEQGAIFIDRFVEATFEEFSLSGGVICQQALQHYWFAGTQTCSVTSSPTYGTTRLPSMTSTSKSCGMRQNFTGLLLW